MILAYLELEDMATITHKYLIASLSAGNMHLCDLITLFDQSYVLQQCGAQL